MEGFFDREPDAVKHGDRSVTMDWIVGEAPGREATKRYLVSYTVSYSLGGVNYFSGGMIPRGYGTSLRFETEEKGPVFTSRGFMAFQGVGGIYTEAATRFNRKRLEAAVAPALARLREVQDAPQVQQVISDARDDLARAQEVAA